MSNIDNVKPIKPLTEEQRAENRRIFAKLDERFGIVRKNPEQKKEVERIDRIKHIEELAKWKPKTRLEKSAEIKAKEFIDSIGS